MAVQTYAALDAAAQRLIVRWEYGSFVLHSLEPFVCERGGWKCGRKLAHAPKLGSVPRDYAYGFDAEGRLVLVREGQWIFFHVRKRDEILRLMFDRTTHELSGRARFFYESGQLVRVVKTWPGRKSVVETHSHDAAGRVVKIAISEPPHTDELEYDETGRLVGVIWRHPTGEGSERFRRRPQADALTRLLPELRKRLVQQIPRVLSRAKIRSEAYALALTCNLEEAPYLLPPKLSVGLAERAGKSEPWSPYELAFFDDAKLELRDRELVALCTRANAPRANDGPVLTLLRNVASELQRKGLGRALNMSRDFVVYAVDPSSESGASAVRKRSPLPIVRRLVKAKLL